MCAATMESEQEKKGRMNSLRVLSALTVLMCITFSVSSSVLWPYLTEVLLIPHLYLCS